MRFWHCFPICPRDRLGPIEWLLEKLVALNFVLGVDVTHVLVHGVVNARTSRAVSVAQLHEPVRGAEGCGRVG